MSISVTAAMPCARACIATGRNFAKAGQRTWHCCFRNQNFLHLRVCLVMWLVAWISLAIAVWRAATVHFLWIVFAALWLLVYRRIRVAHFTHAEQPDRHRFWSADFRLSLAAFKARLLEGPSIMEGTSLHMSAVQSRTQKRTAMSLVSTPESNESGNPG